MSKKAKTIALSAVVAGVVGYVAGILTAPKKGSETRKDIKDASVHVKAETEKNFKKIHAELVKYISQAELKLKNTKSVSSDGLTKALKAASDAKTKVREILSAFHEGDAQDADLKKAINESTKALDHLKKYLSKNAEKNSSNPKKA
ncbi:MAG TPA: YtxH domain-containing protein [Candidatus Saccharimonadales bacterium]|nr:YtxH domain-containing protein [Candidatus Saccharimonadales bacterium]